MNDLNLSIPHCKKHEVFMQLIDPTTPKKGWYCFLCEKENEKKEKENE